MISVAGEILCGSCQFTNDSTAKGCTIKLYNEKHTFYFDMSHPTPGDTSLLECFEVSTPGLFHVEINEIKDASKDYTRLELPDVVISHKAVKQLSNGMCVITILYFRKCVANHNVLVGPSLIGAGVVSVAGGICGSCQFTNDSTAKGCTIQLYNDEHTFYFDVSRPTPRDTSLLECFEVSTPGLFHVEIIEVADNASKDYTRLELPDVVISHKAVKQLSNGMCVILLCAWVCFLSQIGTHTENTVKAPDNILAVTGLSAVLGIVLACVMLAVCILFISLVKRKLQNKNLRPTAQSMLVCLLCKVYNITIFHLSKTMAHLPKTML